MSNNYSIHTADRKTHLKVILVSLFAGLVVVLVGVTAGSNLPNLSTQFEGRGPVVKAGQPVTWTSNAGSVTR